jgi:anaerobic dimethyl sulfoxide reductase subunit C (anchor subunit)
MTLFNSFIEELPLILFTVIAQGAVGLSFLYSLNSGVLLSHPESDHKKFAIIFLAFTLLGMLISVFHLGDPFHAFYMITRIFGFTQNNIYVISWLPLEIVGLGAMLLFGLIIFFRNSKSAILLLPIIGFAMLIAMSNIYGSMAHTIPTWNLGLTLLLFFSSALLVGSFAYMAFFNKNITLLSINIALVGFIFFTLSLFLYSYYLGNLKLDFIHNPFDLADGYYAKLIGWGIVLNGLSLILVFISRSTKNTFLPVIAFLCSFIGILLTRVIFYGLIVSNIFLG